MQRQTRSTGHNSTLAIGGVPSPLDSFVVAESSVLRTNICAEKPAHRQSAKRYMQPYDELTWTDRAKLNRQNQRQPAHILAHFHFFNRKQQTHKKMKKSQNLPTAHHPHHAFRQFVV
jgi:hypothetical protein